MALNPGQEGDPSKDGALFLRYRARLAGLGAPIETKLHPPGVRGEWVERSGLIDELAHTTAKLVLVDAPAGFGKTTLVAQWRSSPAEKRPFAWVSLDRGDGDPGRLWWYVVSALTRACPDFDGEAIRQELRAQAPEFPASALPMLANELAALSAPVVLVLDDYHMIRERRCHEQIRVPAAAPAAVRADRDHHEGRSATAAGTPAGGRGDGRDPGPRAALHAGGGGGADAAVAGIQLSAPDLGQLMERTEGWPAGVYLAAVSLRGHPSPHAFIRQFTGNNRFIVDFLAEEVLSRQPPEIQQFLARTSLLARFCAPLCDAVTGIDRARGDHRGARTGEPVPRAAGRQPAVVPLPPPVRAAAPQPARPDRAGPGDHPARAGERLARGGRSGGGGGPARARRGRRHPGGALIARYWHAYVDSGRTATVRGWMRALGDDRIAASPLAAHCAAWAAGLSGDRNGVRRWLPVLEAGRHDGPLARRDAVAEILRGACCGPRSVSTAFR